MSRKKRKKRARKTTNKLQAQILRDQCNSRLDSIVTNIQTQERVIDHAPFLKLVGIDQPFPEGGTAV